MANYKNFRSIRAAYADCNRAIVELSEKNGRYDNRDVRKVVKGGIKRHLIGMDPTDFAKLTAERRAAVLSVNLEQKEDALDELADQAASQFVRQFDKARRVKLDERELFGDAVIPLEENIRILVKRAGMAEWDIYFKLIAAQVKAQKLAADRVMKRVRDITNGFKRNPDCTTTEALFQRMGWKLIDHPDVIAP